MTIRGFIGRRISQLMTAVTPPSFRQSRGWTLTDTEKRALARGLLGNAEPEPPWDGARILFWEPGGMPGILTRDAVVATALRMRGAEVRFVVCDGAPSACILRESSPAVPLASWKDACPVCRRNCLRELDRFDLPYENLGDLVSLDRRKGFRDLVSQMTAPELSGAGHRDVEAGALALASVKRYFKGTPEVGTDEVTREYLFAALVNTEAACAALERFRPDRIFMSSGCYVDYGTALSAGHQAGVPAVVWGGAYREHHFYIRTIPRGNNKSYQVLSDEAWLARRQEPLSPKASRRLDTYMEKRYTTDFASDLRLKRPPQERDALRREHGIPEGKPVWCIFAHLTWDNVFGYAPMAYGEIEEWMAETIRVIAEVPEVTWLVKVHPAEIDTSTLYGVERFIRDSFDGLPPHVRIIPADSGVNTYGLYTVADGAVTVFGTAGLEMALLGKPVIVSGEAHYMGRGFTHDALHPEEYRRLLRKAPLLGPLTADQRDLARIYGYSYFIERQIPMPAIEGGHDGWGSLDFRKLNLLAPGGDPGLDLLCRRIMDGRDFVMDEALLLDLEEREQEKRG